jgi:hypothetical protein
VETVTGGLCTIYSAWTKRCCICEQGVGAEGREAQVSAREEIGRLALITAIFRYRSHSHDTTRRVVELNIGIPTRSAKHRCVNADRMTMPKRSVLFVWTEC